MVVQGLKYITIYQVRRLLLIRDFFFFFKSWPLDKKIKINLKKNKKNTLMSLCQ